MDTPDYTLKSTCTTCGIEKPLTEEFFPKRQDSKTGFRRQCHECQSEHKKRYRNANIEKVHAKDKRWYATNAERKRENSKRYRAANPESAKRYYTENAARLLENNKRWRAENAEQRRKYNKRWQQANPDKERAKKHRRRAFKRNLLATFTKHDWDVCLSFFDSRCAYCGRPAGLWHTLAQDHFVALINGGTYTPDNIVPACHGDGGCNNSKCARDPQEWLIDKFGKRKAAKILARIKAYFDSL